MNAAALPDNPCALEEGVMGKMRTATGVRRCRVGASFVLLACAAVAGCSSDDGEWSDDAPGVASLPSEASSTSSPLASTCPGPAAGAPTSSWTDCSVGLDPTKNGGDLLWAKAILLGDPPPLATCGPPYYPSPQLALGPTGDMALAMMCYKIGTIYSVTNRFNGSGVKFNALNNYGSSGGAWVEPFIDRRGDLAVFFRRTSASTQSGELVLLGPAGGAQSYPFSPPTSPALGFGGVGPWDSDALGNNFFTVTNFGMPLLMRASLTGQSSLPSFSGSFAADQTGGVLRFGALQGTLDLGCGPMVPPTGNPGSYLARLDSSWGCVYSHALPVPVAVIADGSGGAILSATSSTSLNLGCGALPAGRRGSTFVTRLDASGSCVFGKSIAAPNLKVALDASGRVVLHGLADAASVNLGGGPLQPAGSQDIVVGELDASGHHLWSRRFGAPGVTFANPSVSTSAAGDVYLLLNSSGPIDLGGGGVSGSTVVGSFSPSGAHRWSRGFQFTGSYEAGIDSCGALVVMSTDHSFDPGCGTVLPPPGQPFPTSDDNVAIARFAP